MFIAHRYKEGKFTSESAIEKFKIEIFEENIHPDSLIFGGRILELVSQIAEKAANTHSEKKCKPLGIDFIRYYSSIKKEDILICKASVNRVWNTTLEVGIKVIAEDFRLLEQKNVLSAYFSFVGLDENEKPMKITEVIPQTSLQKKRFVEADKRRFIRNNRSTNHS